MEPTFSLSIAITNDAFGTDEYEQASETARILRELADRIESDGLSCACDLDVLRDLNGNRVGRAQVTLV